MRLVHQMCVTCLFVCVYECIFRLHTMPGGAIHNLAFLYLSTPFGHVPLTKGSSHAHSYNGDSTRWNAVPLSGHLGNERLNKYVKTLMK